ncbi:MAG: hypothetical protein IK094_04720 [Treponema sp.]|nr:hypothetical protein [Treponema sp.]
MKDETKEKASKIWNDIKAGLKNGLSVTKKGLSKAGTTIQAYSDLGVVQLEKKQFEMKLKKAYASLGELVVSKFAAKKTAPLTASDPEVAELLKAIASFKKEIAKREKILKDSSKDSGEKKSAAKKAPAKKPASKKAAKSAK